MSQFEELITFFFLLARFEMEGGKEGGVKESQKVSFEPPPRFFLLECHFDRLGVGEHFLFAGTQKGGGEGRRRREGGKFAMKKYIPYSVSQKKLHHCIHLSPLPDKTEQ